MKSVIQNAQQGLVLLEIVIGLLILAIILPLLVPNWPEIVGRNISDRTIAETNTIWDAARTFYATNGEFPDQANNCADSLTVLEAGGFIGNVGPNNAWGNAITTTCAPGDPAMSVEQAIPADWQSYVLGQLAASADINVTDISTVIAAPGTSAQAFTQLSRVAVAGRPELNRMETDLDMNGNDINNLQDLTANGTITADDVELSSTGTKLSELGRWDVYTGGDPITKPSCPAGGTPDLNIIPVRVCTDPGSTLPIERLDFQVTDTGGGTWTVVPEIFAQDSFYYPTNDACSTFKVQPICR